MDVLILLTTLIFGLTLHKVCVSSCKPKLEYNSASQDPKLNGDIRLDCNVIDCGDEYQLQWRKYLLKPNGEKDEPINLYYYNSNSDHGAFDRDPDYDINGRTDYGESLGVHTLLLFDLNIKDNGTWECAVLEPSDGFDVIIPVKATTDSIKVTPINPPIVNSQIAEFQCEVNGVNPIPWVQWKVGGVNDTGGESKSTIVNDYWTVTNTVQLSFPDTGDVEVNCTVGEGGEIWESKGQNIDVKEKAQIVDQAGDGEIQVDESFSLTCEASGYIPLISWEKDGSIIKVDNPLYTITAEDTPNKQTSTLTSLALDPPYTCDNVTTYGGSYRCVATLAEPYQDSTDISSQMVITIAYYPLPGESRTQEHGTGETNVVLTCEVCASMILSDKWFLNGSDVTDEELPDGTLSIEKITDSSFGNYTRVVTNALGTGTCSVVLVHKSELDISGLSAGEIAGIVIGCLLVVAVIPLILFLVKHYKTNKQKADEEVSAYAESGNAGTANNHVNQANEGTARGNTSAAPPVYAEVNKDKKKKSQVNNKSAAPVYSDVGKDNTKNQTTKAASGPVYSEVNKSGRPLPKHKIRKGSTNTGPVYSEVNKPKQGRLTPIENHSRGGGGGEYEAVGGRPLPPIKNARHYDNAGQRNDHGGLHYADVDFLKQGNGTKQSHGTKNPSYEPTEYAQIDHRKSAGIVV